MKNIYIPIVPLPADLSDPDRLTSTAPPMLEKEISTV